VCVRAVLVALLAVLVGRRGVLLRLVVLALLVVVSRLMVVMGGGVVMGGRLMVVLDGRMFLICHVRRLPEVSKRGASAVNAPMDHTIHINSTHPKCRIHGKVEPILGWLLPP
jgi:hypothetical protein